MKKRDIWFMSYWAKEIGINIIAVIVGIIAALVLFVPLNLIFFMIAGLLPFGDEKENIVIISTIIILTISFSCGVGGYIAGLFAIKKFLLYSSITGIALLFILIISNDFRIKKEIFDLALLIIIVPSTVFGGYLANRKKSHP